MPLVPENIKTERPHGRQDVHNSASTSAAAAHYADRLTGHRVDVHKAGSSQRNVRIPSERCRTSRRGRSLIGRCGQVVPR